MRERVKRESVWGGERKGNGGSSTETRSAHGSYDKWECVWRTMGIEEGGEEEEEEERRRKL